MVSPRLWAQTPDAETPPEDFQAETTSKEQEEITEKQWRQSIQGYLWMMNITGDLQVGGSKADVDIEFDEILDQLSGGISLVYERWNGDWWSYFDGSYVLLKDDPTVSGVELDVETSMTFLEGGIGHRISEEPFPVLFLGFRWIGLDIEVDSPLGSRGRDFDNILDPTVGLYYRKELSDKWDLRLLGDVGGFGVGTELAVGGGAGLVYHFNKRNTFEIGYRVLDIDYEGDIEFDGTMQGIYAGYGWQF
jgi:hypothetical protein